MKREHHSEENLSASQQQHTGSHAAQDFADSDALLQFDAAQTVVPPQIAQRLQESLGPVPAAGSWWKKLLGL